MKASEFVLELQRLIVAHGDHEVIDSDGDPQTVEFDDGGGEDPAFVVD